MWGKVVRAVWNGPFWVGPLVRPVSFGDAVLKLLETIWRFFVVSAIGAAGLGIFALGVANWPQPKPLAAQVVALAAYDEARCGKQFPIFVSLLNRNKVPLARVDFTVSAHEPNRTTQLGAALDWNDAVTRVDYEVDGCYAALELSDPSRAAALVYDVKVTDAAPYTGLLSPLSPTPPVNVPVR